MAAGGAGGARVLTEVVVAGDGLPAEVAHEAPAPARHPVAALRLDQARAALDALPHARCCHAFLAATQEQRKKGRMTRGWKERSKNPKRDNAVSENTTRRLQTVTYSSLSRVAAAVLEATTQGFCFRVRHVVCSMIKSKTEGLKNN